MISKNKSISYASAAIVAVVLYFVLKLIFPKNADTLPFLLFIVLLDLYLWSSFLGYYHSLTLKVKIVLITFFLLPVFMLVIFIITLLLIPITNVSIPLRTYWLGIIIIFYAGKLIPIIFIFLADIIRGIRFLYLLVTGKLNSVVKITRNKVLILTGWGLGLLFFITLLTGMFFWTHAFRIKEHTIVLPELPSSFEGLRIVQISDIHLGSWTSGYQLNRAIEMVNDLDPDYIFVTGDIANFATSDVLPFREELSGLRSKKEIFVIMGNHDYGDYIAWSAEEEKILDREKLYTLFDSLGWVKLLNENRILKQGNDSIAIIGVHNWGKTLRFQRLGDLKKAQKGVEKMDVQLLLSHDPTHWKNVVIKEFPEIDVTFSGHTHAMQMGFYLFGNEYSPAALLYDEWGGFYEHPVAGGSHPQYLYVNRGLGTIGYPGRVGELPEITVFTFRSDE